MKKRSTIVKLFLLLLAIGLLSARWKERRPTIYIIGDSTVKNGKGDGSNGQWGWGSILPTYFDTTRLSVENYALGGTSTRTYFTKGLWEKVLNKLKKDDFLIMQFGHNDSSPLDDTARARGTLKGFGNESKEIYNPITKQQEVVHTYGWYLSKFIKEAKRKGAQVIVCSPIPRNKWIGNKLQRDTDNYPKWAKEVATREQVSFIPLHDLIADYYNQIGEDQVNTFFPSDHTHTNLEGARRNAEIIVETIEKLPDNNLKDYLK
ncbi:rhamnogalacturonan acetylesterase [Olivibacter domesticus]|uniref:Lysophospholipase L1 n=1 Tax=Olivibacter domesticus TaxID=407022 RepID=A0A1H7Y181_OLID1|nr:rhamnogalacturonan acetylesterase [Olivibacter domesticus]SEM39117.1 Lysophospholipase L1 [Olivibacter domesticus]